MQTINFSLKNVHLMIKILSNKQISHVKLMKTYANLISSFWILKLIFFKYLEISRLIFVNTNCSVVKKNTVVYRNIKFSIKGSELSKIYFHFFKHFFFCLIIISG